jgi:flagellar hook protein FlgE
MKMSKRALHIPPDVLALAQLSWPARLILAEILDLYQVTGQVWANDQHFVTRLPGTSLRTVQSAIKELVDAGRLVRETNQKAQHKRLLTPIDLPQNLHEAPADSAGAIANLPQNLREPTAKSAADLPQNLHEAPADSADINTILNTKGNTTQNNAHFSADTEVSASKEFKSDSPDIRQIDQPALAPAPDAGPTFEEFWQAYGKKEDTKKCKLRWKALSPAQRRAALAAVPAYVASKPDRQYRKNPLTWLNGECWQDELPSPPTAGDHPTTSPPIGAPLSLTAEVNEEFEAQQRARQQAAAAERARQFRATYAKP